MEILKGILNKRYWLFLFFIVLVSYGQILWMQPWQDDNALFFKLANLEGPAGFLGKGPLGEGAYKYTAAFFIPIHKLFGFQTTAYFVYSLVFYLIATFTVYKTSSKILDNNSGKVAGFLFASGYIASDGFIRLFNTVVTSLSVIFISLLTLFYWKYYKEKKVFWILISVLCFFASIEFAPARSHYLFSVILLFELIYFQPWRSVKNLLSSVTRIAPFFVLFYYYFLLNADSRSGQIKEFVQAIISGNFYLLHGLFSSFANLIFPDWITNLLLDTHNQLLLKTGVSLPYLYILSFGFFIFLILCAIRISKRFTLAGSVLIALLVVWMISFQTFFSHPTLNLGAREYLLTFVGGASLLAIPFFGILLNSESRKLYFVFSFWAITNLVAYAAYSPTVVYETINRYHAHSFYALVMLSGVIFFNSQKASSFVRNLILVLIISFGVGNALSSFSYQKTVLEERSFPTKAFYEQLKTYIPSVNKGDTLYFDVADNARTRFANAFSVAQMPESTAIAWRYGLDRYDLQMTTQFEELLSLIDEQKISNTHFFYYSKNGLEDTTRESRELMVKGAEKSVEYKVVSSNQGEIEIELARPIQIATPIEVTLDVAARIQDIQQIKFPLRKGNVANSIFSDSLKRKLAFMYNDDKKDFLDNLRVTTSSDWQERKSPNLTDNNLETVWQADRVLWTQQGASLVLELEKTQEVNRFVWLNAYENNTPTEYTIDVSTDGKDWKTVKEIESVRRISNNSMQIVEFPAITAKFVRMSLLETLNSDSPGISEVWVVSTKYKDLKVEEIEEFLKYPFATVNNIEDFTESLERLNHSGHANVYWLGNKGDKWQTSSKAKTSLVYNNKASKLIVDIPPGGTELYKIKLTDFEIPGKVEIRGIRVHWAKLSELKQ